MKQKLMPSSRIIAIIASLTLVAVLFFPMWRIELDAPQYPEGLVLQIHPDKLGGDVEVINGLNHYIGMKTLHTEDFIEFKILPYLIIFFAALAALTAVINRRWWLLVVVILFVLFGIVSMVDFYMWNYNYGHNLDPTAPIKVPGMSYQPPLIGYKQLLNFGAFSIPDTGGWLFITAGVLLFAILFLEWRKGKRPAATARSARIGAALVSLFFISSCNSSPQPLREGVDACAYCKMTITDTRFGAELLTKKGKVFKFDDVQCMAGYQKKSGDTDKDQHAIFFQDFVTRKLLPAKEIQLVRSPSIRSPMASNIAAVADDEQIPEVAGASEVEKIEWNDLIR